MGKVELEYIARACHEVNRSWCQLNGDNSQVPWEMASHAMKESTISGVALALSSPDVGPGDSHRAWLKYKKDEGWKYSVTKDEALKTHPCMVDFEKLPLDDRLKDLLFLTTVRALKKSLAAVLAS